LCVTCGARRRVHHTMGLLITCYLLHTRTNGTAMYGSTRLRE
jgi:hypothetical protein